MNFEKFNKIQATKMNLREMADATAVGDYRNAGCGDHYRIFLKLDDRGGQKVIEDATFTTTGCGFGIAALALACEAAKGKTLEEAARLTTDEIEAGVDGFPPKRKNYPQSALEALQVALENFRSGRKGNAGVTREEVLSAAAQRKPLKGASGESLNLAGADLSGANLEQGNWSGADFSRGRLAGANLRKSVLRGIRAAQADLSKADLGHCDLYKADLSGADLSGADLRNAFLNDADLAGASLRGADLRFCKLTGVKMDRCDFTGAFYDRMTRFDPGVVKPFEVMIQKGESGPFVSDA